MSRGGDLIDAIRSGLPAGIELDEREEALLVIAAAQSADIARAEADIAKRGYLVEGSRGQQVVNPSIGEARQARLALGKLLGQLELPESSSEASMDARRAARQRWRKAS
jgi:hypothetical protein